MPLPIVITNGGQGSEAKIHTGSNSESGLLVYAKNRDEVLLETKAVINPVNGINMAIDATTATTVTEGIHDGTDAVEWTASALSGTWDFASTAQAHSGTKSIDATATTNDDEALIDKGSTFDFSTVTSFVGWIYITSWPTSGTKEVEVQFNDSSQVLVGNSVNISAYVDQTTFNTWQKFIIPLTDMGISNQLIQSLTIKTVDIGGGQAPNYYLDDMETNNSGVGFQYAVEPSNNVDYHIRRIKIVIEDTYLATGSIGGHPFGFTGILGVGALTNGILATVERNGVTTDSGVITGLGDWFIFPQIQNINSGCDGTNTWVTFDLAFETEGGLILRAKSNDRLVYTIRDDLSGLVRFQALAEGYIITNE